MSRSVQSNTPALLAGVDLIKKPFGPVSRLNCTETWPAGEADPASRTKLKATISFLAPNNRTVVPSQLRFRTGRRPVTVRSSSRVTLSSPVFAQTAVTGPGAVRKSDAGKDAAPALDKAAINKLAATVSSRREAP
jgi:hypothetical protein